MKTSLRLIKFLHVFCIICEIAAAIGLVAVVLMAPFLESMVRGGRANVGLYAGHGSLDWSFKARLPYGTHSSIGYDGAEPGARNASSGDTGLEFGYGRVSFGPFRLHLEDGAFPTKARDIKDQAVAIDQIEGTMTLLRPEVAAQALASARLPFVAGMLCTGGIGLAILDLLRRMLKSAIQREVFTGANIRNVQMVGLLIIVSSVLKLAAGAWLVSRMTSFVIQHVATGNVAVETYSQGDVSMATGLLILALAEVFRQGLVLKEENQLTI
ncbi:MAG TPA: DUF2975 domain-containing protein [Opitutaceae bacterium]|nr:DUF2975 domain-containing protein [Opitutaceae bacterium]